MSLHHTVETVEMHVQSIASEYLIVSCQQCLQQWSLRAGQARV